MSSKEQEILDAIEYSMYMYPGVDGVIEEFKHDFLKGYICQKVDHALYNRVGMARLSEDKVDQTIKDVITYYTSKGINNIGWNISPQSTPEKLEEKLKEYGFEKDILYLGMVRAISEELNIEITDEFTFKKFEGEEAVNMFKKLEIQRIMDISFGYPEGTAQIFGLMSDMFRNTKFIMYLAYDKETSKPVAFSCISNVPNTKISILNGAATLPNYQKRGIYSAMLKLRHEKAKEKGIEHLIIQGDENTSAPIAAKNSFKQRCVLPSYVFKAESNESMLQ